jgi:hypothetical protein
MRKWSNCKDWAIDRANDHDHDHDFDFDFDFELSFIVIPPCLWFCDWCDEKPTNSSKSDRLYPFQSRNDDNTHRRSSESTKSTETFASYSESRQIIIFRSSETSACEVNQGWSSIAMIYEKGISSKRKYLPILLLMIQERNTFLSCCLFQMASQIYG